MELALLELGEMRDEARGGVALAMGEAPDLGEELGIGKLRWSCNRSLHGIFYHEISRRSVAGGNPRQLCKMHDGTPPSASIR